MRIALWRSRISKRLQNTMMSIFRRRHGGTSAFIRNVTGNGLPPKALPRASANRRDFLSDREANHKEKHENRFAFLPRRLSNCCPRLLRYDSASTLTLRSPQIQEFSSALTVFRNPAATDQVSLLRSWQMIVFGRKTLLVGQGFQAARCEFSRISSRHAAGDNALTGA